MSPLELRLKESRLEFADWLKTNHPEIFARAVAIAENSTRNALPNNGLGQIFGPPAPETTGGESFWSKFSSAAIGLGTTYLTLKNQRDAMKINLERAQQGQPPIDMATSAPVIRTEVDISPELANRLIAGVGTGLNTTMLIGVAAVAAFFLMRK